MELVQAQESALEQVPWSELGMEPVLVLETGRGRNLGWEQAPVGSQWSHCAV